MDKKFDAGEKVYIKLKLEKEFDYLRKNSKGQYVFSYLVKKGDTKTSIVGKFNSTNTEKYNEVSKKYS